MKKTLLNLIVFFLVFSLWGCENKTHIKRIRYKKNEAVFVVKTKLTNHNLSNDEENETPIPPKEPEKNDPVYPDNQTSKDIVVSYEPKVVNNGKTHTGLPSLSPVQFTVKDPSNSRGLKDEGISFSFGVAKNGKPHSITVNNQKQFDSYQTNALAWDNKTQEKVLYLTFDCGYEYENLTSQILDTLKEKHVSAAFFCTQSYLESSSETVSRMINEGHIVGNHSMTHPSNCAALSREQLAKEVLGVHNYLRVNFGYNSKYFRFPTGTYSQNALDLVNSVGYRSVFWSIAHSDWDPENQPGVDVSFETITSRLHPGAVILLHSTSPDNVKILGDLIDYAIGQGYEFKTLDQYPYWNN